MRRMSWALGMLAILVLLAGCPSNSKTVPDVVGQTQAAAATAITGAGLTVGAVTQQYSATVASGSVISQSPASGASARRGSTVDMVVSLGVQPVVVPNVAGMTQAAATAALAGAGLSVGTVTQQYSATVASGTIISQSPASGTSVSPGSSVDMVVSRGVQPVVVPDVAGMTQAAAANALTDAGLTAGTMTQAHSSTVASGSVISQSPLSGASVSPGSAVALIISEGPEPVLVPNVVGMTQAAAGTAITSTLLSVGTVTQLYSTIAPAGQVLSQNPAAGTDVAPGTAVNLEVSKGPEPVLVPDVTGMTQAAAGTVITNALLAVGAVAQLYSATVPPGHIVNQVPAAGESVAPGTAVRVAVSQGPATGDVVTVMLPGDVPLEMVWIPAGTFTMGSPDTEQERHPDEGPQHTVTLDGFWMGKCEVTQGQWAPLMDGNPSYFRAGNAGIPAGTNTDNLPVEGVTWNSVQNFVAAVNGHMRTTGQPFAGFRLPTEAEWEYACRAGTTTRYYWGDEIPCLHIDTYAWNHQKTDGSTHPVGMLAPNAWGLHDMSGNVWEWCGDCYSATYYSGGSMTNPTGPGTGANRVLRGGCWYDENANCRSACRNGASTIDWGYEYGFRLAMSVPPLEVALFVINSGTPSTSSRTVTLENACTVSPTEYMASEQPDFNGASWQPYTFSPSWTLSPGDGPKTVWLKVRNAFTESPVAFDGITLKENAEPAMEMVSVPAGTFIMGNSGVGEDVIHPNWVGQELPQHQVTLDAYQIGKYEVTNRQYCDVLNWALAQGYLLTETGAAWTGTGNLYAGGNVQHIFACSEPICGIQYSDGLFSPKTQPGLLGLAYSMEAHPVVLVSWYGAKAFCNWLSQMRGLATCYDMTAENWPLTSAPPTPGGYRLPTEAEWERAAAWDGTKHWIYGFTGDTLTDNTRCNYIINNPLGLTASPLTTPVGWFDGSPNSSLTTVNSVSPVGAYDMCGNVAEWCGDWYSDSYYQGGAMVNPTGPETGYQHPYRGGHWSASAWDSRSATRAPGNMNPLGVLNCIGFRVVR